jgi:hypothetical protein
MTVGRIRPRGAVLPISLTSQHHFSSSNRLASIGIRIKIQTHWALQSPFQVPNPSPGPVPRAHSPSVHLHSACSATGPVMLPTTCSPPISSSYDLHVFMALNSDQIPITTHQDTFSSLSHFLSIALFCFLQSTCHDYFWAGGMAQGREHFLVKP